jgi:raffinose/stachyose/melibiose transport system permease protein
MTRRAGTLALWLACAVFLLPFVFMAATAVRASASTLDAVLNQMHYARSVVNTVLVTVLACALVGVLGSAASYPLGRATASWSTTAFRCLMVAASLPVVVVLAPLYLLLRDLHLLGTEPGLVVVFTAVNLPLAVVYYTARVRQLPLALEEAAACDGCGPLQTYLSVVLPYLRPATGTLLTFVALQIWNDLLIPLVFVGNPGRRTVMANAYALVDPYTVQPGRLLPAAALGAAPVLVLLLCLRRRVADVVAVSAVTT